MINLVPISNKKGEISRWFWEGNWNPWPAEDFDGTKATSCLVESKRWEIEKASNLVFDLKIVGEVLARRNGACSSINSILV